MLSYKPNLNHTRTVIDAARALPDGPDNRYIGAMAGSLLAFAGRDPLFCAELKRLTGDMAQGPAEPIRLETPSPLFIPADADTAVERAGWLVARLKENIWTNGNGITAGLKAGIRGLESSDPRQLIVGIAGLAIPGVTLGLIKKRRRLSVIIDPDLARAAPAWIVAEKTARASLGILSLSLALVRHDIKKIEPELADWFYGEREIALYRTDNFSFVKNELEKTGVLFSESGYRGRTALLGLSPAINIEEAPRGWKLKRLNG
ncbi:MAG: hypothetical protein V1867_07470 [Candidatus Falkowbacteria bacterium]